MPTDTTPDPRDMERLPEAQRIPEPQRGRPAAAPVQAPDMTRRPALPAHPERMAADIEDEDADPVVDTGPGIDDGPGR